MITAESQLSRARTEGWLYDGTIATEGEVVNLIASLVWATKPATVVETGTASGKTTKAILDALGQNARGTLWSVENDPGFAEALRETAVNFPRLRFIEADSLVWAQEAAPEVIDIAFVDCGEPEHRLEVMRALWPRIAPHGLLLVHDVSFYPRLLADAERVFGPPSLCLSGLNGLAIWQADGN